MSTYDRYKQAKKENQAAETNRRKDERLEHGRMLYEQWLREGCPPISKYAKRLGIGMSARRIETLMSYADKEMPFRERRLSWSWRSRDYKRAGELTDFNSVVCETWNRVADHDSYFKNPPGGEQWLRANSIIESAVASTRNQSASREEWINAAVAAVIGGAVG